MLTVISQCENGFSRDNTLPFCCTVNTVVLCLNSYNRNTLESPTITIVYQLQITKADQMTFFPSDVSI